MDFVDVLSKLQDASSVGMEDLADKLNFFYSVMIYLLCASVVTAKQYMSDPISCYIPTAPGGRDFDDYVKNYCWLHGTIPFRAGESLPSDDKGWKAEDKNRLYYYQWIPFVLALQCLLFYAPRVFWQIFCYNQTGTDLEHVVGMASKAVHSDQESRQKLIKHVTDTLEDMLFQHRDNRTGRAANMRRKAYKLCSFLVISKRLGTWLVVVYIFTKLLYIVNAVGQLFMMTKFLGFKNNMSHFGPALVGHILNGTEWEDTLYFSRVTYCYIENVRHLGSNNNKYVAQCSLPVNMLSEKIYIFLWFWTTFVAVATALSLPFWIVRITLQNNKVTFIKKYLRNTESLVSQDKKLITNFCRSFLRHDGVFLLRMIAINAGDLVTSRIVTQLFEVYKKKYWDRDLRDDTNHGNNYNMSLRLEPGGHSTAMFRKRPSAPPELSEEDKPLKECFV